MHDTPVLLVEKLSVTLGGQVVLKDVALSVAPHNIVTVLGSNGVGKTTLMRTISGLYRQATGIVRHNGADILGQQPHVIVKAGISQSPEGRHIFPNMTVGENLRAGASVRPAREVAGTLEGIMRLFPVLKDRFRQSAGSLSGGEQQMLAIARAMMARPSLLLLDEPSLGLAPKIVRQIFDLVVQIRAAGTSVLLVEQNARAALHIADHAYVMEGGRTVMDGPAADLARNQRVVAAYLGGGSAQS